MEYCPYCGTLLKKTNFGRNFCPNCGIVDELEETSSKETPNYCG